MRKPNFNCKICSKHIYKRPSEIQKGRVFCSSKCFGVSLITLKYCVVCGTALLKSSKFCSRTCSNLGRKGIAYNQSIVKAPNSSQRNLKLLMKTFNFTSCMVEGCQYNKVYEIHRLIEGKYGGKYEIGNMFAICPNHHAEIHKGIISVSKVNNFTLRIN